MNYKLLTKEQTAELLTIKPELLSQWVHRGKFPKPIELVEGGGKRYRESMVLNWIKEREEAANNG